VDLLVRDPGLSPVLARLLASRGVVDGDAARRFLSPDLERDWASPTHIPGMDDAATQVADAVRSGGRIVVFGDFDVDGLSAAAVACRGLVALGADAIATVPHRFREGYGLSDASVERLLQMGPSLVVTVDCGISARAEVAALEAAGVRVVVTDHHEPSGDEPLGVPVADPKLPGEGFEGLAGAGVALKLVQAVGGLVGRPDAWLDLIDLAALGTIGDVVPMLGENRALVADGIERIRRDARPAIAALCDVAGLSPSDMTAEAVAFGLAPRINAAGRMADPAEALELLMTDDPARALELARALDGYNQARKAVEQDLFEAAKAQAEERFEPGSRVLTLVGEGWHEGVKGIVASRIVGLYGVPTLLFAVEGDVAHGSGRSVSGVDLHAAVTECAEMLTRFGGHAAAVGVTLPAARLPEFEECLARALSRVPEEAFVPHLTIDAEVPLVDVGLELAAELATLEPFGADNPRPLLASRSVFMTGRRRVGKESNHLRFDAYDGLASAPAIAFRLPDIADAHACDTTVDLAFNLEVDEWQGRRRVQLFVRDLEIHEQPATDPAAEIVEDLFADAERILARGDYERIEDAESFHTKLAGVTFEGRQDVIARLTSGEALRLVRQPDNEFDPNACAVFDPRGDQVGFFNRRLSAALAPAIDAGALYDVSVADVTGGDDGKGLGVNVVVERRVDQAVAALAEETASRRAELAALAPDALDAALVSALIGDRSLHGAQSESLDHLAAGRRCLTVMATGRGKSLIFQLHAARIALAGGKASIFVYPLRALVADQAFYLSETFRSLGLSVAVVTGETSLGARDEAFAALADGRTDAVLTTPEFLERNATRFLETGRVDFVVVDEAHHVGLARAGHRPAYGRLGSTIEALGGPTLLATTATAGPDIAAAITGTLGIEAVVADPSVRDNLSLEDRRGKGDKVAQVSALAARGEKLIVYVNSREQSVRIAQRLRQTSGRLANRCAFYNGGMNRAARHAIERAFREGDISAVVATSAFGEGVNIPDVRHVALFHLPFNRVEFNQMCGRAGRDGRRSTVHVLFSDKDARVNELILEGTAPDVEDLRALYVALRTRFTDSGGEAFEVTNAELAQDVKRRRPSTRMSDRGVSAGLGVFRELGLLSGEGAGGYRRLSLEPAPADKLDIATSVRYAEGLREVEEFAEFRDWALGASADELLTTIDRPILP
jgi:single-stranded-DNA-specific exonuclease